MRGRAMIRELDRGHSRWAALWGEENGVPTYLDVIDMDRGGTFYKILGLYLRFHARFIHATLIGVTLNFWKVGVAPTTPLYTKTPPLDMDF